MQRLRKRSRPSSWQRQHQRTSSRAAAQTAPHRGMRLAFTCAAPAWWCATWSSTLRRGGGCSAPSTALMWSALPAPSPHCWGLLGRVRAGQTGRELQAGMGQCVLPASGQGPFCRRRCARCSAPAAAQGGVGCQLVKRCTTTLSSTRWTGSPASRGTLDSAGLAAVLRRHITWQSGFRAAGGKVADLVLSSPAPRPQPHPPPARGLGVPCFAAGRCACATLAPPGCSHPSQPTSLPPCRQDHVAAPDCGAGGAHLGPRVLRRPGHHRPGRAGPRTWLRLPGARRPAPPAAARREQPALRLRRAGRAARSAPLALRTEWRKAPAAQRRESNRQCLSPSRCPGLPPLTCAPWGLLQGYALFRHMTVADNITFGPRMRKMGIDLDAK